jgi:filamentous hemagglutinin
VAAGGNVTGGLGQFAENATVAYLQELGTNQVKQIADNLGSEEARAALHAIVGCAGAAAGSQSCGAGAMGAATSSVLGSLLAPSANLSASEREARDNLVASLVAGVAAVSGQNVATATGAGKIEVENNQVSIGRTVTGPQNVPQGMGGYFGEQRKKGDGVIADPATALDPTIKPTGSLIYPMPDAKTVGDWITAIIPDQIKGLVDYVIAATGGSNNRLPIPETVTADNGLQVASNPKHTLGMPGNRPNAGTEPSNSLDLFNSSIPGGDNTRYAIDSRGNINRFYSDGNGVYHWSGSTGDSSAPLNVSKIPIDVRRSLGFKGK